MTQLRPIRGRRARFAQNLRDNARQAESHAVAAVGWEHSAPPPLEPAAAPDRAAPLQPQLLSLLADPRVDAITVDGAAAALAVPRQDVEAAVEALRMAGTLIAVPGAIPRYTVPIEVKAELEAEFREAAVELGEHGLLARLHHETALVPLEDEEPRLPATAGLLSLFLPGTGQLLNGDIGRASLVFAVWSLAWITHLSPVWTFVCLYAGAEAFFTAKIRSMERKLALEQGAAATAKKQLPSPRMT